MSITLLRVESSLEDTLVYVLLDSAAETCGRPVIHSGEADMNMLIIPQSLYRQYFSNTKQYFGNKANPRNEIGNLCEWLSIAIKVQIPGNIRALVKWITRFEFFHDFTQSLVT